MTPETKKAIIDSMPEGYVLDKGDYLESEDGVYVWDNSKLPEVEEDARILVKQMQDFCIKHGKISGLGVFFSIAFPKEFKQDGASMTGATNVQGSTDAVITAIRTSIKSDPDLTEILLPACGINPMAAMFLAMAAQADSDDDINVAPVPMAKGGQA